MEIIQERWSGEGGFTQQLVDWFSGQSAISLVRVEDAPSARSEVEYNFISNEIYLEFATRDRLERRRLWGIIPVRQAVAEKLTTLGRIEADLAASEDLGPPDYADKGMIQYLHTERIVPPYQTRGYKLIELVRIYEAGTARRE